MMAGVDHGHYDGALLIGYHAGGANPRGTLSHTLSGEFFHEVRLNGRVVSEAAISAAIAFHFGVPVLLVAGDDVAAQESLEQLGDVATATLKTSLGWLSAMHALACRGRCASACGCERRGLAHRASGASTAGDTLRA